MKKVRMFSLILLSVLIISFTQAACNYLDLPAPGEIKDRAGGLSLIAGKEGLTAYQPGYAHLNWMMFHGGDYVTLSGTAYISFQWEYEGNHRPEGEGAQAPPTIEGDITYIGALPDSSYYMGHYLPGTNSHIHLFCIDGTATIRDNEHSAGYPGWYNIMVNPVSAGCVQTVTSKATNAYTGPFRQEIYNRCVQKLGTGEVPCKESDWRFTLSPIKCNETLKQTKTWIKKNDCSGGVSHPKTEIVSCVPAKCNESNWEYSINPLICPDSGIQTITWTMADFCAGGVEHPEQETLNCMYKDLDFDKVNNAFDLCPDTPENTQVNKRGCPYPELGEFENYSMNLDFKDLNDVSNFYIGNENGTITFLEDVSLINDEGTLDIKDNVIINQNNASIDSDNLPQLNKRASIRFNNLVLNDPIVLADKELCENCPIAENTGNSVTIEVEGFSTYQVVERLDYELSFMSVRTTPDYSENCTSEWKCGEWGLCKDGIKKKQCRDINFCADDWKIETSNCSGKCDENWVCSKWSPDKCIFSSLQTRTCRDSNECGTEDYPPYETQSCSAIGMSILKIAGVLVLIAGLVFVYFRYFKGKLEQVFDKSQKKDEKPKQFGKY